MKLTLSKELDLEEIRVLPNIAVELKDTDLAVIGHLVVQGYEEDKESRKEWEDQIKTAIDLAELKGGVKNYPWYNASNVKYPLLTTANIQFAARTYPEIIRNGKVVEVAVVGKDLDGSKAERAKRISSFMSYQLVIESPDWEADTDRLLNVLPTYGVVFRKVCFDPIQGRNVSTTCLYDEIIVNDNIKSLTTAKRITHLITKSRNELMEQIRAGLYTDDVELINRLSNGDDKDLCLLEQHRWLDLDQDGYEEPYIVTVEKESQKVLRIVARFDSTGIQTNSKGEIMSIKPVEYFSDFHFIPNPSGKYHSIGFGHLLTPLNSAVNTILNQLLDAGNLANTQGGFISSKIRSKEKEIKLKMGEFKVLNLQDQSKLSDNIFPMQYKEPSTVLFQLLGTLIQATKELSSVTDALTGTQEAQNVPATTMLALIEQGLKVFSSIQRRLYRGFKKEFDMLFRLNRIYLDPVVYADTMDDQLAVFRTDFEDESMDIKPIADPNMSSDAQRLARTQVYMNLIQSGLVDPIEAMRRYLNDLDIPAPDALMPKPSNEIPIEMLQLQADIAKEAESLRLREQDLMLRAKEAEVRAAKTQAEISKTMADAVESIAKAESLEVGNNLAQYQMQLKGMQMSFDNLQTEFDRIAKYNPQSYLGAIDTAKQATSAPKQEAPEEQVTGEETNVASNQGPVEGMEGPSNNADTISAALEGEE